MNVVWKDTALWNNSGTEKIYIYIYIFFENIWEEKDCLGHCKQKFSYNLVSVIKSTSSCVFD